jgi:uncharacterized protein
MWLHKARIPHIATEIVGPLVKGGDIETESPREVQLDVEAVLNQYLADLQEINERARDLAAQRGSQGAEAARIRKLIADQKKIAIGDDAIDYLLDQLVEMLMHSHNVDEVYAPDFELRRKMRDPLRREQAAEDDLEQEVRGRLKHVQEGTQMWEIEYRRMLEDIKRRKGL